MELQLEAVNCATKWVLLVLGSSPSTASSNGKELITGEAQMDPSVASGKAAKPPFQKALYITAVHCM